MFRKILFIAGTVMLLATQAQAVLFWARPYDPNLGRWIQRDPIGERGGINLYDYVGGNPVNEIDPLGLAWLTFINENYGKPRFGSDKPDKLFMTIWVSDNSNDDFQQAQDFSGDHSWDSALGMVGGVKMGGRFTEPLLPTRTICKSKGVEISHYYRSGDHGPAHLHIEGGGPSTKIGQNGNPLDGSPELSATQKQVVQENKSAIRKAIDAIQRWFRYNTLDEN